MGLFRRRAVAAAAIEADFEEARWAERREHERRHVEVCVDLATEHNFYQGFTENVSLGGIFISTYQRLPVGERLVVRLHFDDGGGPADVPCQVRWIRPDSDDSVGGMGMRFVELDDAARSRIESFLQYREPLFYEE